MNPDEIKTAEEAKLFIKDKLNITTLCNHFADAQKYPPEANPVSVFMAGSPGAGKTEFSKSFIEQLGKAAVRIDADEIRKFLPHFKGNNSEVVQGASAIGVEKLYDCCLKRKQNLVLDGTFMDYDKSVNNIERSLHKNRIVSIFYIFQDPVRAWELTKAREAIEHRNVPKEIFIKAFLGSKENVNNAKAYFGNKIELNLVIKNYENGLDKFYLKINNVDSHLPKWYDESTLETMII